MITYKNRKKIENLLRKSPNFFSNSVIALFNPLRKKLLKKNVQPKWITLFITNYCSAKCGHCFYSKELNNKIEHLNLDNLKRIFSSLKNPLNTIRITGGEPFLNKNIDEFILYLDQKKIAKKIAITSHGMVPNLDDRVKSILTKKKNVHLHIGISLDGMNETHDNFRKIKNGFDLAIKHLKSFKSYSDNYKNFSVSTTTSLIRDLTMKKDKNGKSELFKLLDYLKEKVSITNCGFDHVRTVENDVFDVPEEIKSNFGLPPIKNDIDKTKHTRADEVNLSVDEIKKINDEIKKSGVLNNDYLTMRRLEIEYEIIKNKKPVIDCLAGYVDCVIYPSLDVAVCESTKPFENLKNFNFDLLKLLNSNHAKKRRELTSKCSCTHPCHLSDSMAYDTKFLKEYFSN